jgi:hypothetical protein
LLNTNADIFYKYIGTNFERGVKVSDNQVGTFYEVIPGDKSCWLGYDFGKKTTAYISKIIYQPRLDKTFLHRYNGIKF